MACPRRRALRRVGAVAAGHRLTIQSIVPDPRAAEIAAAAQHLGLALPDPAAVTVADIVFVDGPLTDDHLETLEQFLVDPLLQRGTWEVPAGGIEITVHPGVTDTAAA